MILLEGSRLRRGHSARRVGDAVVPGQHANPRVVRVRRSASELVEGRKMMQPQEKLLEHCVLNQHVHRPLAFLAVEGRRRVEVDPFVLSEDPQSTHPVDRRRQRELRIRLAVRLVDRALCDDAVVQHEFSI